MIRMSKYTVILREEVEGANFLLSILKLSLSYEKLSDVFLYIIRVVPRIYAFVPFFHGDEGFLFVNFYMEGLQWIKQD